MKHLITLLASLAFCLHMNAQDKVKLSDLGVSPPTYNPNTINGPLTPVPKPVPTIQQQLNSAYQQSQSSPTISPTTQTVTPPGHYSGGLKVTVPIQGSGITPTSSGSAKASAQ